MMDRRSGFGTAGTYLAEGNAGETETVQDAKDKTASWAGCVCDKIVTLVISETHFSPKSVVDDFTYDKAGDAKDMAYYKADYPNDFAYDKAGKTWLTRSLDTDAKDMAYDKAGNAKEMAYERARHLPMT
ncbi:unnamed protein product [Brassica rapa subsp. trilocularis]